MLLLIRLNLAFIFIAGVSSAQNIPGVYTSAGMGQSICASWKAYLQGSIGDSVTSPVWSTSGDGTFNDATILDAIYTPGPSDISSRTAILALSAKRIGSGETVSDDMILTIVPAVPRQPELVTGAPVTVCPPLYGIHLRTNQDPEATNYVWSSLHPGVNFLPPSTVDTQIVDLLPITTPEHVIYVTAFNLCGASPARAVHIKRILKVSVLTGDVVACAGNNKVYSCNRVESAVSYKWKSTAGIFLNGHVGNTITTDTTVNVSFPGAFKSGTIEVAAMTDCFTGPFKTIFVTDSILSISTVTGNSSVCPPGTEMYSILPLPGASGYTWTLPPNTSGISQTNFINLNFDTSFSGNNNLCVSVTSICGISSVPVCKTITKGPPLVPGLISGPVAGICSQNVTYSVEPAPGVSYNWHVPAGVAINGPLHGNNISVTISSTMSTGKIRVCAKNSCGTSAMQSLIIKGTPTKPGKIITNIYPVYSFTEGVKFSSKLSEFASECTYSWSYPSSANYVSGQGTNNLVLNWGEESGPVILTATNSCGSSANMYFVNINAKRETGNAGIQNDNSKPGEIPAAAEHSFNLQAYPDVENKNIILTFFADEAGSYLYSIIDDSGREVINGSIEAEEGVNMQYIDMSALPKNIVYSLKLSSGKNSNHINIRME